MANIRKVFLQITKADIGFYFPTRLCTRSLARSLNRSLSLSPAISHSTNVLILPRDVIHSSLYAQHSRFPEWLQRFCLNAPTVSVFLLHGKRLLQ